MNATSRSAGMPRGVLAAMLVGNFVEWFDFAVYGAFAGTLASVFFPTQDPAAGLTSSLAVFAIGFVFRPVGGALLGVIGDRYGRRAALSAAVLGMSGATAVIALLPTYRAIGIAAPLLLTALRSVQGLSAGGEWTSAGAFLAEYAPAKSRGAWLSLISASAGVSLAAGTLSALLLRLSLTPQALSDWGWRVPFLVAAPLGLVGLFMRLRLDETPVFRELQGRGAVVKTPLREALRTNRREILIAFVCSSITGVGFYYFATYFANALAADARIGGTQAFFISTGALLVYSIVLCPLAGALSDRIGRKKTYVMSALGLAVLVWATFSLIGSGSPVLVFLGVILFAVPQSGLNSMVSVTLVELFPPHTRSAGAALAYGLGLGPVAGTAPLVANALMSATGSVYAPAAYLAAIAAVAGVAMAVLLPETRGRNLSGASLASPAEPVAATGTASVESAPEAKRL